MTQQKMFITNSFAPLAERMRANILRDFVGQTHILNKDSVLYNSIINAKVTSSIFWGPPGCGKTTLANIIANATDSYFVMLNAVSSGVADAKKVIEQASVNISTSGKKTYLMLDECHRWSKAQSDCVLAAVEKGIIIFIGSTTENPYVSMTPAIVSRCRVYEFKHLTDSEISSALLRATKVQYGLPNVTIDSEALKIIVSMAAGDLRNAYNSLELAANASQLNADGSINVIKEIATQVVQKKPLSIDNTMYYDMISAFCKSLRGSNPTAALFYFERLIQAGADPMLLARRLVVHSSEDVGMADPQALVVTTSAMYALEKIGLPEARIPLANAIIYVCNAPKSNEVVTALGQASDDAQFYPNAQVPFHLMDGNHSRSSDQGTPNGYKYPHDYGGYVEQQYMPDELKHRNYMKKK